MKFRSWLLVSTGAALFTASPTAAQSNTPVPPSPTAIPPGSAAADDPEVLPVGSPEVQPGDEAIIVTGSRIQGGTFNAPTPVTSLSQETLAAAGPSTLAEGLKQLPSVTPGGGPTAGGGTGNGGQNFIGLRQLGNGRTLTLVDGRRFTPSNPANLVDSNLIPQGLVQRVDVVTGGASAAYGSDAVGGVVNFILDTRFEGLEVNLQSGLSQELDNSEQKVQVNFGTSALDDRLHVIAGAEYFNGAGVSGGAREFRRTAPNQLQNPSPTGPRRLRGTDLRTPFTTGGLVAVGAGGSAANNQLIRGIQFARGGVPVPYDYGTISTTIGSVGGTQNGGDGFRVSTGQEIVRPLNRKTLFGHMEFDISDNLRVFVEGTYGKSLAEFESSPTTRTLTIQRTNPYLIAAAPALVAEMTRLGVPRLSLNRLTLEAGLSVQENYNELMRGLVGASGNVFGDWAWDVHYQQGRNENYNPFNANLIIPNFTRAVDAVRLPSGEIVCADTVSTNAATRAAAVGCQPFNPFGAGSPSQASLDYVFGVSEFTTITEQKAAAANVSGDLFELPAGPLQVAVGAEWREIEATTTADPLSNAGSFRLVNQQDFYGKYSIKEVYGELQVPVLLNSPVGNLDVNLAARHTNYSTSGGVNTWKVGVSWEVIDSLRLRGTRSRDIRAPNLQELFATGRQNNITVPDTLTGNTFLSVPNQTFGNPDLRPEVADTMVIGLVFRPEFFSGFNFAMDYWNIKIRESIGNIGGNNAVEQCNRSNQTAEVCSFVTRDPVTNAIIRTRTSPFNLTEERTDGIDAEVGYRLPLGSVGGEPGSLSIRVLGSYVFENITISPLVATAINQAGDGGFPHLRATTSFNYEAGPFGLTSQVRYIGEQIWDKELVLGVDTDFNHIDAHVYVDAQVSYKIPFGDYDQEVYLNVQNLLDKDPPYAPSPGGATPTPTDTALYDQVGRMFRIGFRGKF